MKKKVIIGICIASMTVAGCKATKSTNEAVPVLTPATESTAQSSEKVYFSIPVTETEDTSAEAATIDLETMEITAQPK